MKIIRIPYNSVTFIWCVSTFFFLLTVTALKDDQKAKQEDYVLYFTEGIAKAS